MLKSFKKLIAQKSDIINNIDDEVFTSLVVDQLQKATHDKSDKLKNQGLIHFAATLQPGEAHMMHDAYSHHVSRYKAAKEQGKNDIANQHAQQALRTLYLADRTHGLSNGKLKIGSKTADDKHRENKFIDIKPWERNRYLETSSGNKYTTDTYGFRRAMEKNPHGWDVVSHSPHPHSGVHGNNKYKHEIQSHGHNEAYPFHANLINNKFPHIEDHEQIESFESHPFDSHPVYKIALESGKHRTTDHDEKYFHDQEEWRKQKLDPFIESHKQFHEQNPEQYMQRGQEMPNPVHQSIHPPLDLTVQEHEKHTPANKQKLRNEEKDIQTKQNTHSVLDKLLETNPDLADAVNKYKQARPIEE